MPHIKIGQWRYEYRITDDREPRLEVFAPDGFVFMPDNVSSFVCDDTQDAINRVASSVLEMESKEND